VGLNSTEMSVDLGAGAASSSLARTTSTAWWPSNPIGVTCLRVSPERPPAAWNYLRPILAENKGWAAFVSTPRGKNHFPLHLTRRRRQLRAGFTSS